MKGRNTSEIQGFDYEKVDDLYGPVDMKGGKRTIKKSPKFSEFDFEKEWKEFEESYNQKYGGASKKKKAPAKKPSSVKKAPAKKSAKKATKRKYQRGGDESGATFAPSQMFDEKAMNAPPSGPFQSAYGTINAVDGLDRNLAPYPNSSGQQTGGAKKKGSKAKKPTKPKNDKKKKNIKKTRETGKNESVLDKIKKFFSI